MAPRVRFVLEAAFIVAVATTAGVAHLGRTVKGGAVVIAWTARNAWLAIEAGTIAGLLTIGAFWARARRRGISKARNTHTTSHSGASPRGCR